VKERPILFSAPMVVAILEGRKTQTRRIIKPQPKDWQIPEPCCIETTEGWQGPIDRSLWADQADQNDGEPRSCPYGKPGDRLWVRETHYRYGHWEPVPGVKTRTGKQKMKFVADSDVVFFDPPALHRKSMNKKTPELSTWYKRLARFMPRSLCRIDLEITAVRVEKLDEISEADAVAEGVIVTAPDSLNARDEYRCLWDKINGPGAWDKNPWVWCLTFKRVKP
jgi:hypothetical protein